MIIMIIIIYPCIHSFLIADIWWHPLRTCCANVVLLGSRKPFLCYKPLLSWCQCFCCSSGMRSGTSACWEGTTDVCRDHWLWTYCKTRIFQRWSTSGPIKVCGSFTLGSVRRQDRFLPSVLGISPSGFVKG